MSLHVYFSNTILSSSNSVFAYVFDFSIKFICQKLLVSNYLDVIYLLPFCIESNNSFITLFLYRSILFLQLSSVTTNLLALFSDNVWFFFEESYLVILNSFHNTKILTTHNTLQREEEVKFQRGKVWRIWWMLKLSV